VEKEDEEKWKELVREDKRKFEETLSITEGMVAFYKEEGIDSLKEAVEGAFALYWKSLYKKGGRTKPKPPHEGHNKTEVNS